MPTEGDPTVELLAAVARGDAERGDVAASLRDQGIDALEILIALVERAGRSGRAGQARFSRSLDPRPSARQNAPAAPPSVHREPRVPFLLGGTLYDPKDIERFQGQELHFVLAPSRDHLVVVDDRETMNNVWQLQFLAANVSEPVKMLKEDATGGFVSTLGETGGGNPRGTSRRPDEERPERGTPGSGFPTPPVDGIPGSFPGNPAVMLFFEDINGEGASLSLGPNEFYPNLLEVASGPFGLGDWNDEISSLYGVNVGQAVLHEHVELTGSSLTVGYDMDLHRSGWGDRASSVEAF